MWLHELGLTHSIRSRSWNLAIKWCNMLMNIRYSRFSKGVHFSNSACNKDSYDSITKFKIPPTLKLRHRPRCRHKTQKLEKKKRKETKNTREEEKERYSPNQWRTVWYAYAPPPCCSSPCRMRRMPLAWLGLGLSFSRFPWLCSS